VRDDSRKEKKLDDEEKGTKQGKQSPSVLSGGLQKTVDEGGRGFETMY